MKVELYDNPPREGDKVREYDGSIAIVCGQRVDYTFALNNPLEIVARAVYMTPLEIDALTNAVRQLEHNLGANMIDRDAAYLRGVLARAKI